MRMVHEAKQQLEEEANQQHLDVVVQLAQQQESCDMAQHTLLGEVWFRQVQLGIHAFCSHEEQVSGEVEKRRVARARKWAAHVSDVRTVKQEAQLRRVED
jgi:hypothetical protein